MILPGGAKKSVNNFLISGFLIVTVLVLRKVTDGKNIFRAIMIGLSIFLIYNVALGSYNGGEILWLYIFPLICFFLFGIFEGFIWISLLMISVFIMFFFPDLINSFNSTVGFKIRFIISITIVTIVACLLESLRLYFYKLLETQKTELEIALQNIKTLTLANKFYLIVNDLFLFE